MKKRYLILEDGTIFQGWAFGADKAVIGELVFNTSVVGYVENMTDPAYCGQILMQTFPMAGNYGIMEEDFDGKPMLSGFVAKEFCSMPSNFRCEYDLDTFLKDHDIPGLCGVDTRELTNRIREYGVVNAMITEKLPEVFEEIAAFTIKDTVAKATCETVQIIDAEGQKQFHVVLIDYGTQKSLIRAFTTRGCQVTVVPAFTSAEDILALAPDGIVLSGGPGNPAENTSCIEVIRQLVGKKPIFGMGLGHQMLAIAMGGQTKKMKYGHRSGNQPCRAVNGTRTYITSQNHGYEVKTESVPGAEEIFRNVNDGTCEGLDYPGKKAFSVQFHPDGCTVGAANNNELYARFLTMMKEG
ncbi:MAG: glutamine-hydrolyzing carbamoyl-phosphate synthase small subunit [Oscillospiraceae bacterium]|nr:glutamine-hydrolyzing carbamoyl-phosphate synthase small subunit [Oscillospiraceae bacterium]